MSFVLRPDGVAKTALVRRWRGDIADGHGRDAVSRLSTAAVVRKSAAGCGDGQGWAMLRRPPFEPVAVPDPPKTRAVGSASITGAPGGAPDEIVERAGMTRDTRGC